MLVAPFCDAHVVDGPRPTTDERATGTAAAPPAPIAGFLERFRRSGGVPASVGGDTAAELAPVFASLDQFEAEAVEIRRDAEASTEHVIDAARNEAERVVADARLRSEAERNVAMQARLLAADAEVAAVLDRAQTEARRIAAAGEQRLPALVAEVLARATEVGA